MVTKLDTNDVQEYQEKFKGRKAGTHTDTKHKKIKHKKKLLDWE